MYKEAKINGFNDNYWIDTNGNVYRYWNGLKKLISAGLSHRGYLLVKLCSNSKSKGMSVHRLVAMAFIPNPDNKPTVNHINGIKTDNRVENLEWATHIEQKAHAIENGLWIPLKSGADHNRSKSVYQYSLAGSLINTFGSCREAARKIGFTHTPISKACRRSGLFAGFIWSYNMESITPQNNDHGK